MVNRRISLLMAFLISSFVLISCNHNNRIIEPTITYIRIASGEKYSEVLTSEVISISISPKSSLTPAKSIKGRFRITNNYLQAGISIEDFNYPRKGDISRAIGVCTDIKPGENIVIGYEYLAADDSVVESGQITLAKVVYDCK